MIDPQSDLEIFRLFGWRCVECNIRMATQINHIVPRSRDKTLIDDWRNKAPMCSVCHDQYHAGGVTREKIQSLQRRRADALKRMHKSEYV